MNYVITRIEVKDPGHIAKDEAHLGEKKRKPRPPQKRHINKFNRNCQRPWMVARVSDSVICCNSKPPSIPLGIRFRIARLESKIGNSC